MLSAVVCSQMCSVSPLLPGFRMHSIVLTDTCCSECVVSRTGPPLGYTYSLSPTRTKSGWSGVTLYWILNLNECYRQNVIGRGGGVRLRRRIRSLSVGGTGSEYVAVSALFTPRRVRTRSSRCPWTSDTSSSDDFAQILNPTTGHASYALLYYASPPRATTCGSR